MVKNPPANARDIRDTGLIPGLGIHCGRGHGNPTPVFFPGGSHGQRSLVGYSPWDHKQSDTTEQLTLSLHFSHFIGNVPRHHP